MTYIRSNLSYISIIYALSVFLSRKDGRIFCMKIRSRHHEDTLGFLLRALQNKKTRVERVLFGFLFLCVHMLSRCHGENRERSPIWP